MGGGGVWPERWLRRGVAQAGGGLALEPLKSQLSPSPNSGKPQGHVSCSAGATGPEGKTTGCPCLGFGGEPRRGWGVH